MSDSARKMKGKVALYDIAQKICFKVRQLAVVGSKYLGNLYYDMFLFICLQYFLRAETLETDRIAAQ